jgi:glycine/D-amino acid oxidase-like deaminating enzyme
MHVAKKLDLEIRTGFENFKHLTTQIDCDAFDGGYLRTPGGTVRGKRVVACTGGYTGQGLIPIVKNKVMPVLSSSVVTRPLTDAELKATDFRSMALTSGRWPC